MAILIKRYANRKLYNTQSSRYITLKGIAKLLDEGEEVRVIDKETGEDITQVALSQILVDNQRAKQDPSDTLLTQILSRGGDALYGAIKKSVDEATDGLGDFQDRFRQFVSQPESIARGGRGFRRDDRGGTHRSPFGHAQDRGANDRDDEAQTEECEAEDGPDRRSGFSDFREAIQSAVGNALDLDALGDFPRKRDFDELNRNLNRVADAIDQLETTLREQQSSSD